MRGAFRWLTSLRTTVAILCLMGFLLLLGVVLPQASVLGEERFAALVDSSSSWRFLLVTLGLGRIAVSPVFLGALALFFFHLVAVLLSRIAPTWRRTRPKQRSASGLLAWSRTDEAFAIPLPGGWNPGRAAGALLDHGYRPQTPGKRAVWGVRHRTAPLGFLLFHLSFLLLCAGGVMLYYTRLVAAVQLTEGQRFSGEGARILRPPPSGRAPAFELMLQEVELEFEDGQAVHLGARIQFLQDGSAVERRAWVNHPATWGAASVLTQRAGLAPVFWLQDASGFTLDRVAATATRGVEGSWVPLADGLIMVFVEPIEAIGGLPSRSELPSTALTLQVFVDERLEFEGALHPGEAVVIADDLRLVLEEIRYWAGLLIVAERGGGILITGFLLAVVGLVWRLLFHRREVAVTWDDEELRLAGHSEYFPQRFRGELESLLAALESSPGGTGKAAKREAGTEVDG